MHRLIKTDAVRAVNVTLIVTARDPIKDEKFENIEPSIIEGGGNKYHLILRT